MERRFDSNAFVNDGPLVVDVPLTPVYCDIILRVVDASTGLDITDGDASIHGVHLGRDDGRDCGSSSTAGSH